FLLCVSDWSRTLTSIVRYLLLHRRTGTARRRHHTSVTRAYPHDGRIDNDHRRRRRARRRRRLGLSPHRLGRLHPGVPAALRPVGIPCPCPGRRRAQAPFVPPAVLRYPPAGRVVPAAPLHGGHHP